MSGSLLFYDVKPFTFQGCYNKIKTDWRIRRDCILPEFRKNIIGEEEKMN